MRLIRLHALLTVPILAASLTACGSATQQPAAAPAEGYPLTVQNCGRDVTLTQRPERIVSLNQGTTEVLLSLGAADRMVGTADWTDPILPSLSGENDRVKRLADNKPSLETVLDQEPDLVTSSFSSTLGPGGITTTEELAQLGVPSYLSAIECTKEPGNADGKRTATLELAQIFTEIGDLSTMIGSPADGDALIADMQERLDAVSQQRTEGVSALYWFANSESPYLAGCCGGPGIITRTLGLTNVFEDNEADWPQIGWETVAARNPDVLVIGDLTRQSQTAETAQAKIQFLESNPVTREMDAVKNKRYIPLAGAELNPSIRMVDAMEKVANGIEQFGLAN